MRTWMMQMPLQERAVLELSRPAPRAATAQRLLDRRINEAGSRCGTGPAAAAPCACMLAVPGALRGAAIRPFLLRAPAQIPYGGSDWECRSCRTRCSSGHGEPRKPKVSGPTADPRLIVSEAKVGYPEALLRVHLGLFVEKFVADPCTGTQGAYA